MAEAKYTRFQAWIKRASNPTPWGGFITDENCYVLAFGGTTPSPAQRAKLKPQMLNIKKALLAGRTVETTSGTITPTE